MFSANLVNLTLKTSRINDLDTLDQGDLLNSLKHVRIKIFIVEDKAIKNCINFKTTSLYISTNTFQAMCSYLKPLC